MKLDTQITASAATESMLLPSRTAKCYLLQQLAGYTFSLLGQQLPLSNVTGARSDVLYRPMVVLINVF